MEPTKCGGIGLSHEALHGFAAHFPVQGAQHLPHECSEQCAEHRWTPPPAPWSHSRHGVMMSWHGRWCGDMGSYGMALLHHPCPASSHLSYSAALEDLTSNVFSIFSTCYNRLVLQFYLLWKRHNPRSSNFFPTSLFFYFMESFITHQTWLALFLWDVTRNLPPISETKARLISCQISSHQVVEEASWFFLKDLLPVFPSCTQHRKTVMEKTYWWLDPNTFTHRWINPTRFKNWIFQLKCFPPKL